MNMSAYQTTRSSVSPFCLIHLVSVVPGSEGLLNMPLLTLGMNESHHPSKSDVKLSCLKRYQHVPGNDARRESQNSGLLCSSGRRVHDHIPGVLGKERETVRDLAVWEAGPGVRAGDPIAHKLCSPPGLLSLRRRAPSFLSKDMTSLLYVSLLKSLPFTPRCAWVMRTRSVTSQKCQLAAVMELSQEGV